MYAQTVHMDAGYPHSSSSFPTNVFDLSQADKDTDLEHALHVLHVTVLVSKHVMIEHFLSLQH